MQLGSSAENGQDLGWLRLAEARDENRVERIFDDLLSDDMARFECKLDEALAPQKKYLAEEELEIYRRGKKLRPAMLLLSARMIHGAAPVPDKVIMAATSLEMLHVATMIHDDIIDDALVRRGLTSVNARRGTNAAILLGDMQFVQAIRTFVDAIEFKTEMELVKLVLDTAFRICAGELDELQTNPMLETAVLRERYFEVIERKTAIMFGLACETGMSLVQGRTSDARRIGFYGRRVGRAFQVVDDLLDLLQDESDSGKHRGMDIEQRRMTLPIIYAMEALGPDHLLTRAMRGAHLRAAEIDKCLNAIGRTNATERAYADARHQAIDSLTYLEPFPESVYREALREIAMFTVNRGF
ncbi:MAG TPA: polyprenyl synthetase family protein [Terracidiphilus sp.]|nr:polyprenyl synthetase family protein [Terracidiphilus sp.]